MCELFDASVGKVLDKLDETGLGERHPCRLYDRPWRGCGRARDVVEEQLLRGVGGGALDRAIAWSCARRIEESGSSATRSTSRQRSWRHQGPVSCPKSQVVRCGRSCRAGRTKTRPDETFSELHGMTGVPGFGHRPALTDGASGTVEAVLLSGTRRASAVQPRPTTPENSSTWGPIRHTLTCGSA